MTGAAKNTVVKLLVDLGATCAEYQDATLRDLPCTDIQCDEIWSFCYSKQKNVPDEHRGTFGYGDIWTWTAICADTKLVPSWLVGERTTADAWTFIHDLRARLAHRVQLTTDGHRSYVKAVEFTFGQDIDFSMLHKMARPRATLSRSAATALPSAPGPTFGSSAAIPTLSGSQPATSSARTSRCGWGCAASRA